MYVTAGWLQWYSRQDYLNKMAAEGVRDSSAGSFEDGVGDSVNLSSSSSHKPFVSPIRLSKKGILPGSVVRDSPKSPILQLQTPGKTPLEDFQKFFTELDIAFEYKLLSQHNPSGVYIHPSEKSIREWHGVIFIRSGPYEAGIFKFTLYLTDGFPKSRPIIKFISRVVHPLIHPKTGIFNYSSEFPSWTPHQDHVWNVLHYMKLCFYDNTTWPSEEEDAEDFKSEKYKQKILSSVRESLLQVNHPKFDDHEHSIVFPPVDDAMYIAAKKLMLAGKNPEPPKQDGESSFFEVIQTQVVSLLDKMSFQ